MCPQGLSNAACESIINWYVTSELEKCTWEGLAKAMHAVEDRYAGGHRNLHEYKGLFATDMIPHVIMDYLVTDAEKTEVAHIAMNLIKQWLEKCRCQLHSGASGTWSSGASGKW